ncbi:hypothetical protein NSE01_21380 [Novosphingobium sediminis]|uniref:Uncharacterized protein n=1 Tax=Novosphingobium sediminis TaxID=707214 RepID=A0A512AKU6_9SPHN|nr:hypothetical protein [Novosphingobium sediminis]GEO00306.1 hypothetical protein NSE01_21380 [Novosphingobium sediminis]
MTPNTNIQQTFTINHSFLAGHPVLRKNHMAAPMRRTSPVLTTQELRQIVEQMVD